MHVAQRLSYMAAIGLLLAVSLQGSAAELQPGDTLIRSVRLITMEDAETVKSKAVIIRDGRIAAIVSEPANEAGVDGVTVIDGQGGFLAPGYVDAHIHYRHPDELLNFLAYGVTTVVSLGQDFEESAELLQHRESISDGAMIGPQVYTTAAIVSNGIEISSPAEARAYVERLSSEGYDFIKIYNETPRGVFDAIVDAAREHDLAVLGHVPRNFAPELSLSGGLDVVAHAEELYFTYYEGFRDKELPTMTGSDLPDLDKTPTLIDLMRDNEVALIPTLGGGFAHMVFWDDDEAVFADPELRFLHPRLTSLWRSVNVLQRKPLDKRMLRERIKYGLTHEVTRRLFEAGVPIVTGTDAGVPNMPPGKSLHRELRELVKAGLTSEQAFAAATSEAGQFIRRYVDHDARIGLIRVGHEADFVLLANDPRTNVRNARSILGVMSDGRWYSAETLGQLRAERSERYARLRDLATRVRSAVDAAVAPVDILELVESLGFEDDDAMSYLEDLVEGLGYEAFKRGEVEDVLRIIRLNTELFPDSADAWDTLGEVYEHLDMKDEALAAYRRALENDPAYEHARERVESLEKGGS